MSIWHALGHWLASKSLKTSGKGSKQKGGEEEETEKQKNRMFAEN